MSRLATVTVLSSISHFVESWSSSKLTAPNFQLWPSLVGWFNFDIERRIHVQWAASVPSLSSSMNMISRLVSKCHTAAARHCVKRLWLTIATFTHDLPVHDKCRVGFSLHHHLLHPLHSHHRRLPNRSLHRLYSRHHPLNRPDLLSFRQNSI